MPVVTTLHTILKDPSPDQRWVLEEIAGLSPPPIETSQGWLMIYHGVKQNAAGAIYRLGLAL